MNKKTSLITVQNISVTIMSFDQRDYISLTDMAKARTDVMWHVPVGQLFDLWE